MKEITPAELKAKIENNDDFQLIDIREPYEYEIAHLDGELIPMGELLSNLQRISREKEVIIYCRSGNRSAAVIDALEKEFGFSNLLNLKGGILAYADQIDRTLTKY